MTEEPQTSISHREIKRRGEQPVVPLTSAFDTWRVYGILKILRIVPTCQISHQDESAGYFVVDRRPMSLTHTSKLAQCMSGRQVEA